MPSDKECNPVVLVFLMSNNWDISRNRCDSKFLCSSDWSSQKTPLRATTIPTGTSKMYRFPFSVLSSGPITSTAILFWNGPQRCTLGVCHDWECSVLYEMRVCRVVDTSSQHQLYNGASKTSLSLSPAFFPLQNALRLCCRATAEELSLLGSSAVTAAADAADH